MKKIAILLSLLVIALTGYPVYSGEVIDARNKQTAPGDVLVTLKNQSGTKITRETFSVMSDFSVMNSFASSIGASVKDVYPALSEAGNEFFMLIHSDTFVRKRVARKTQENA